MLHLVFVNIDANSESWHGLVLTISGSLRIQIIIGSSSWCFSQKDILQSPCGILLECGMITNLCNIKVWIDLNDCVTTEVNLKHIIKIHPKLTSTNIKNNYMLLLCILNKASQIVSNSIQSRGKRSTISGLVIHTDIKILDARLLKMRNQCSAISGLASTNWSNETN